MEVKKIKVSSLKEDPKNLREHSLTNIEMIKNSIKTHGQYKPLIVDKQTMIVKAGNGRLRALKQLGYEQCYVVLTNATDSLAVIDNRLNELSEWNDNQINNWLVNEKSNDWWGIDVDLSKQLEKLTKKKTNKKNDIEKKKYLCPCCGNQLKKKIGFDLE